MLVALVTPLLCKHTHTHTFTDMHLDITRIPCVVKNVAQPAGAHEGGVCMSIYILSNFGIFESLAGPADFLLRFKQIRVKC